MRGKVGDVAAPRILVADDQPDVLEAMRLLAKAHKFEVRTATSPAAALALVEGEDLDVCLLDLNYARDTTSGREGLDLIARVRAIAPDVPIIVMTAWGSIEGAVEAMQRGARDYLQKPWDNARLVATLQTHIELSRALRAQRRLESEAARRRRDEMPEMVAESRAMQGVVGMLERVAASGEAVLITGEHGTGKEVAARWLHAASKRSDGSFVAVNAGGLGEGVLESELFGHVKGAFTDARADRAGCFELADHGTLFLDEIANMPMSQQARLLRVLETGEFHPVGSSRARKVDVRVVAATNADIARAAADGRFREDLLYRLNTVEVRLPPLRERKEDIPRLAALFLARHAERGMVRRFTPAAMAALLTHPWPGNVRELVHVVARAVLLAPSEMIDVGDLVLRTREAGPRVEDMTLDAAERYLIERALAAHHGNVVAAAAALGVSRSALYRRLASLGIRAGA
ncbi:MAG TPA: sigma-54 dependent transcriptional regulator [Kofleriaceae bacterium]|nr:sigma-54 dependent transcriptional regulator [Kofleriaceae bacterium]